MSIIYLPLYTFVTVISFQIVVPCSAHSMACIELEEYETAKAAFEIGASLAPGDSRFTDMIKECEELIAGNLTEYLVC